VVQVWPDGKRFQGTYYQGIKHGEGTFRPEPQSVSGDSRNPKGDPQQNGWFFCALGGWWLWMAAPYTSGLKATSKHLWNYLLRWPDGSSYIGNFEANNLPEPYIQQTSADKCANKLTVSVELRCDPCRQERHWYVFMGRWPELHWWVGSLIWAFPKIGGTPKASILIYSVGFSMKKKNNFWIFLVSLIYGKLHL